MDQFRAPLHHLQQHRNHPTEFRNCRNSWMYDRKLNLFPAISDIEMLGTDGKHHGSMFKNKSCLLCNIFVCDTAIVEILIQNPIVLGK